MPTDYAIEVKDVRKSYGKTAVLKGINLKVERGTMLALLGPNGAGKTTTVRILSTLLDFDGGSAVVNGFDLATEADAVRGVIGLTGQYAAVDEYLSGRENLVMMGKLYRLSAANSKTRAEELLAQFDLLDAADRSVKTYSGGMRRRLDLAASLIATPPIIYLDEPTTGLDPRSRLAMWDVIRDLMKSGATILLTTQYLEEADQLADKIAVIDHGTVIAEGTASELKAKIGTDHLELVVSAENLDAAKKAAGKGAKADETTRTVSVSLKGTSQLQDILAAFEEAHIQIESIAIQKPTLDDVFMQLTGQPTNESPSND
jgi:ABC-2 type transport system ATP-binding protein